MKVLYYLLFVVVSGCMCPATAPAQSQYSIPDCSLSESQKFAGDRLRLPLPKGAIIKRGRDADYEDYYIGFGVKKNRVWLSGIFGLTATVGKVSKEWLSISSDITERVWKSGGGEGVDVKGKLANGNYWRYLGLYGESIKYYDVPVEAAAYFDGIIENLCYQDWQ
jgi:hypothetical protein